MTTHDAAGPRENFWLPWAAAVLLFVVSLALAWQVARLTKVTTTLRAKLERTGPTSASTDSERGEEKETMTQSPPEVTPDADWIAADPLNLEATGRRSFVSGGRAGDRLRVAYFRREGEPGLVGRAWFGPGAEGPPGHAHGGSVAAVLDEAMGSSAWQDGYPVVAAKLVTNFRKMLPLGTDARFEARVIRVEGRKVWAEGRLTDDDGDVFTEAEGLFIILPEERLEEFRRQFESSESETD